MVQKNNRNDGDVHLKNHSKPPKPLKKPKPPKSIKDPHKTPKKNSKPPKTSQKLKIIKNIAT